MLLLSTTLVSFNLVSTFVGTLISIAQQIESFLENLMSFWKFRPKTHIHYQVLCSLHHKSCPTIVQPIGMWHLVRQSYILLSQFQCGSKGDVKDLPYKIFQLPIKPLHILFNKMKHIFSVVRNIIGSHHQSKWICISHVVPITINYTQKMTPSKFMRFYLDLSQNKKINVNMKTLLILWRITSYC
jgi:hypothetical protein